MRTPICILSAAVLLFGAIGQPVSGQRKKSAATQPQTNTIQNAQAQAQRDLLRRQANGIFDREMQRAKDGDCDTAATSAAIDQCLTQRVAITDLNLKTYETAIRGLLALEPKSSAQTPSSGSAVSLTQEFDQMEREWHAYLATASTAAAHQFGEGTGGPAAGMITHLQIVRGHMKELDNIYFSLLHL